MVVELLVPGSVPRAVHILFQRALITVLQSWYYYSYLAKEETEV